VGEEDGRAVNPEFP